MGIFIAYSLFLPDKPLPLEEDPTRSDQALFEFRLFQCKLRGILLQIFHQLINSLSGHIIHHKNAFTSSVDQPLSHHRDIGIW